MKKVKLFEPIGRIRKVRYGTIEFFFAMDDDTAWYNWVQCLQATGYLQATDTPTLPLP